MTGVLIVGCIVASVALVLLGRALGLDGPWEPKP